MTSVPISKFKARCLAMLEAVHKTGVPLRVTRFGKPIADIVPASQAAPADWIGAMRGTGEIVGDIDGAGRRGSGLGRVGRTHSSESRTRRRRA